MDYLQASMSAVAETRVCIDGLRAVAQSHNSHVAQSREAISDSLRVLRELRSPWAVWLDEAVAP